jgi:hypothetical protein
MTPKEKAKELVSKYVHLAKQSTGANGTIYNSKQCALIAVDEIIEGVERAFDEYEKANDIYVKNRIFYWDFYSDVKSEIYKL